MTKCLVCGKECSTDYEQYESTYTYYDVDVDDILKYQCAVHNECMKNILSVYIKKVLM